jgi:PAS domain S-box-containing protein
MPVDSHTEILQLRTVLRDLVAFSTIPAAWVGREPSAIAAELADMLLGSLGLDFAFVRLCDPKGSAAVQVTRGNRWSRFPQWLSDHLVDGEFSCKEIVPDIGGGEPCHGVVMPIGVNGGGGLAAAACDRPDFPNQIDQLLLSVAANNAATAFQNACLRNELDAKVAELRQARDELEMTVAKRTADLRRSEAYLAEAQRLTHTGSWACNIATGEMRHSSEEHSRLYGFDPDRGISSFEEVVQRIHPEDRGRVVEIAERANCVGKDFELDFRVVLPGGTTKYMHGVGHPIFAASGDVVEFVGILMDVTERRRADEERERLRQAQADLTHLSRVTTMGELTASLAHEVNQPIAAAVTDANTCLRWLNRDRPDVEEAREAASRTIKDATRAAEIISRTRMLFKKGTPERELVDMNQVIQEMVALLRSETTRYSVSVLSNLGAELPQVIGDRVQLQQVLMNLMMNGIDAMKDVDGTRELAITSEPAEGEQVMVSVGDTGVGLPAGQADQIFNAFFTTKLHGTGMGLRISRSIVEAHGGRLWATDNSPRGASFHLTLPTRIETHE